MRSATFLLLAAAAAAFEAAPWPYPPAEPGTVVETLHGVEVRDPFRWLEDLESPRTRAFVDAEEALTLSTLRADPEFAGLRARLLEISSLGRASVPVVRGTLAFSLRTPPGESRADLWVESDAGERRVLVAAGELAEDEAVVGFWPDPEGRIVAYGVGKLASRWFQLRFLALDGSAARRLPDALDGLNTAGLAIAWLGDGRLVYGRYPNAAGERTQAGALAGHALLVHLPGRPQAEDEVLLADAAHPLRTYAASLSDDGRLLAVSAREADPARNRLFFADLSRGLSRIERTLDREDAGYTFLHGSGRTAYVRTTQGAARGRVVAIDLDDPAPGRWRTVIAEAADALYFANVVDSRLIAVYVHDARHVVKVFGLDGRFERDVPLPDLGTTFSGFVGRPRDRHAYYSFTGLAWPGVVFRLDPRSGHSQPFGAERLPFDPAAFETRQVFYRSADGTRVPMFVAHKRGLKPDARTPGYLYAYGSFGWAATPWFQGHVLAWMERGGVYALANVRGGGEYGREWYEAGIREKRQNAVDDLLAAARFLQDEGLVGRGRLALNTGSASAPLGAVALLQKPELFAAAAIDIPIFDMLRFAKFPGGHRWAGEFGRVEVAADFRQLLRHSPYHQLDANRCLPPLLVTAGEKDETAVPSHAYKFTAAVQRNRSCASPALLQVVRGGGHGFGTSPEQTADTLAGQLTFLLRGLRSVP